MRGIAAALLSISLAVSATVSVTSVSEAQNRSSWDTGRFVVGKTTCLQARHSCSRTSAYLGGCQKRYESCVATGCWNGGLVKGCGYVRQ